MPLAEFVELLARQSRISVIAAEGIDKRPVTITAYNERVSDVLGLVARRAGVGMLRTENFYYLGQLAPEDRGVMVTRVLGLATNQIESAVKTVMSKDGVLSVNDAGLVIVSDRIEILTRVRSMLDQVESSPSPVWVVQLYLVSQTQEEVDKLQVDAAPSVDLAVTFAGASLLSGPTLGNRANVSASFDALMDLAKNRSSRWLVASPLFLLSDGATGEIHNGQQLRIPQRGIDQFGNAAVLSFEVVETGLTVTVAVRERGDQKAQLKVTGSIDRIENVVEGLPVVAGSRFTSDAVIRSGGVYLLNQVDEAESIAGTKGGLKWGHDRSDTARVLQVWCRAYRIGGSGVAARASGPSERAPQPVVETFERLPKVKG